MRRAIAVLTISAAAVLGLAGCSGSPAPVTSLSGGADAPGDNGQSTADACALIQQTIDDATTEFEASSESNPAEVVDGMRAAAQKLADTAPQVTNDQVAALLPPLQDMFAEVSDVMEAIVKGDVSKVGDLSDLGTQYQTTSQQLQDLCGP